MKAFFNKNASFSSLHFLDFPVFAARAPHRLIPFQESGTMKP